MPPSATRSVMYDAASAALGLITPVRGRSSSVGRPTLYGVVAGGCAGAARAFDIFRNEIDLTMAQMGAPDIKSLGPQFLMWRDQDDLRRNVRP